MRVLVFSDRSDAGRWFRKTAASRGHAVERHPARALADLRRLAADAVVPLLACIDAGARTPAALAAAVRRAAAVAGVLPAVLDPGGTVADPAALLRAGAVDYLGPALLKRGLDPRRLRAAASWAQARRPGASSGGPAAASAARASGEPRAAREARRQQPRSGASRSAGRPAFEAELSGSGWRTVRSGEEYVFVLMFIELDNQDVLRRDHGSESLTKFQQTFHDTIAGVAASAQGRPWMWSEFGGVLLFPFDGERCDVVVTCFRLMLNRKLLAIEMYDFDILPAFRIALHIGATTFHARGETGRIVSESVNTIFHLGQRFSKPGGYCMTETLVPFIPAGLREFFVPAGRFESHDIWRMRQPL